MVNKDQLSDLRQLVNKQGSKKAKIISFFGPKGGAGKTTVALNTALSLTLSNAKVLFMDFDITSGSIEAMIGANFKFNLYSYLNGNADEEEIISKGPLGLDIISGITKNRNPDFKVGFVEIRKFVNLVEILSPKYDFIFIDTGSFLDTSIFELVKRTDFLILISTPEPTAIHDTVVFLEECDKKINKKVLFRHVLNKIETVDDPYLIETLLFDKCESFNNVEIDLFSHINFDKNIFRTIVNQVPFIVEFPFSEESIEIKRMGKYIMKYYKFKKKSDVKKIVENFTINYLD